MRSSASSPGSAEGRIYRLLFRWVLERIDPERAHTLASRGLRIVTASPAMRRALRRLLATRDERLSVRALGLDLSSPLGLAAGFDKDASWFESLATLGFGFVEVGTVTAEAQPGNERPRIFRAPEDRAVINSMGFPNCGAEVVSARLARHAARTIVGVNVGKTRRTPIADVEADYQASVRELAPVADYLVINVSSPNTPGLRDMQAIDRLASLISSTRSTLHELGLRVPLLVKIAPDLGDAEIEAIADLAVEAALDGIVAVNSTTDAHGLSRSLEQLGVSGPCGISGAPLKERAVEVLERLHARVGDRVVLVSVGGIETPADAWQRIRAGATLLQAHTGFVYGGPLWPHRMNRELARLVSEAGLDSIQDAIGARGQLPADRAGRHTADRGSGAQPSPATFPH
jgi:dihydroorotate dehydrogenase